MLYIHGTGHFHPENELSNAFLEGLDIGTNAQWILERVGIQNRRTVLPLDYIRHTRNKDLRAAQEAALYTNAETGRRAAEMAMARAGVKPEQIGMVICGGCTPDTCIPAEASRVACALGLEVPAFDLHTACSSFGTQLHFLNQLGAAAPEFVLVVSPENMTRAVDYSDRNTAVLFGDGTSAAVVSTRVPARVCVTRTSFGGSPKGADEVRVPRTGYFWQNGPAVHKFAIKKMASLLEELQQGLTPEAAERLVYIGHQANLPMLESVARRCNIPAERHFMNIVGYGNQCAAGAPIVLSQHWETLKEGDVLGLIVVGSGLAWSSLQIEVR
ncbi:3-oxoacyl-ACP synthase III family protein [Chondromyces apiculatus]|uniref:3-oxoacyl-[acyl-carrier-protein] synthase, KASIII n=1 Tax=Chondromyces apiculatus DSM 436 TaxID=1192034 RepID=A0A017T9P2_9BACT|nr:ketoacyl-ACP synthase III [Chondromyces apiculatus]EYF05988.1 3-oxoacyl-[acyl-carrier-protein] synthase, KASIII [Chondromyces apiculatus DSM 436]